MVVGKRVLLGLSVLFCLLFGTCSLGTDINTLLAMSATYTVSFESNGGSNVAAQTVNSGKTAARPADPTRSGYTFFDWYSNSALTTAYNFSTPVTGDITLYAGWNSSPSTQTPVIEDYNINIISPQMIDRDIIPVTITPIGGKSNGRITVYYEGVSGTTYSRTTTVPWAAGTYAVTFDVAAAASWKSASRLFAGVLTLNDPNKENPRLEHYDISGTGTFDFAAGTSRPVTLTRKDNSSPGTVTVKYTNAATPPVTSTSAPTEIGAYAVSFDVDAAPEWNAASGLSVGAVNIINSAFRTPDAGDYIISGTGEFTYDGVPKAVTATPQIGKSQGARTYIYTNAASGTGTSTAPSAVGTYDVTFTVAADPANNWNAVSGLIAGTLVITATTNGISLSETGAYTFPPATVGYDMQNAWPVTVTNLAGNQATGALAVELSGDNASSFTLSTTLISSIAAGGIDTFTVVPNIGLGVGTYTAVVTVSGSNGISAAFSVSFTVNPTTPTYSISLSQTDTYTFPPATVGYAEQTAQSVTVTNTGNQTTGVLTVALSGTNAGSFTLSKTSISSIAVSGTGTFTVRPNTDLGVGTYTATVTVSGSNGISAAFSVSFTVNSSTGNIVSPTGIEMIFVPGGSFEMGKELGTAGSGDVTPVHTVTLTDFYIGKYQVTQAQYQAVMGSNPSYFSSNPASGEVQENRPVESVSWYGAVEFCNALSIKEDLNPYYTIDKGKIDPNNISLYDQYQWTVTWNASANGYRLPTEAQWEYAAKGGNGTPGNYTYSGSNTIGDVAWYNRNSNMPHEVGKKAANGLGIYDMSGNVDEWCWDWDGGYSSEAQTNPGGASAGGYRVLRGGSWCDNPSDVRSVARYSEPPDRRGGSDYSIGFRLVRSSDTVSSFTSITEFGSWLSNQPANTAATAYSVALNVNYLGGRASTSRSLGYVLNTNPTKYVNLDLSGSTITSIGIETFNGCTNLTGVTLPDGVTSIGDRAFSFCSIASITIPNSITRIGIQTFSGCGSLTSVIIPDSVESIGAAAFFWCTSLTSVIIPNSVTSIEWTAFENCSSLTSVIIPDSVTSIGWGAFLSCTSLTSVTFQRTNINISIVGDYSTFPGDLRTKYLAGGIGTYTTTNPGDDAVWTKQP